MEDEEKGYEVIDKRAARQENETRAREEAEARQAAGEPRVEAEEPAEEQDHDHDHEHEHDEPMSVSVYGLLQWFVEMLAAGAWHAMGLQMNETTKKVEKDMVQAKIAVDTVVFMTDQLAPHVPEEQRRAYRALVSDLRVNFVQQSEKND